MLTPIGIVLNKTKVDPMENEVNFECSMCGRCCSQRLVLLNTADIFRLAAHFNLSIPGFMEKYGVVFATTAANKNPRLYLRIIGEKCPFYSEGRGCTVHAIKPLICKLFPGVKPVQTARDVKDFINEHAISEGIKSCKIFMIPDDTLIAVDREAMVKSAIYDSIETIYYRNLERNDMEFALRLLRIADREDLRNVVYDYLFNGNRDSGLVFEQTMFEIQALCQVNDWKKLPYLVAHDGVTAEAGTIYVHVSPEDARNILSMSTSDEIETIFCQVNPSIADNRCAFISVAIKTTKEKGLMLAFPILKEDLYKAAPDGKVMLAFFPSDGSMEQVGAVSLRIDHTSLK